MSCHHSSKVGSCATSAPEVQDPLAMFNTGEKIPCTVQQTESGGYAVEAGTEKLPGFVATEKSLKQGERIEAVVVCVHKGRLLLAFTGAKRT